MLYADFSYVSLSEPESFGGNGSEPFSSTYGREGKYASIYL